MKKFFMFAFFAIVVAAISNLISTLKEQFQGLTEPQVRDKLHSKMSDKIPTEKIDEIVDKIIEAMKERDFLVEEPVDDAEA